MKLDTPEIAWHGKEPILSVDFSKIGSTWRLASAGADNDVKVESQNVQNLFHKITGAFSSVFCHGYSIWSVFMLALSLIPTQIWSIVSSEDQHSKIEFLANLSRHTKAVNVVKFSPKGKVTRTLILLYCFLGECGDQIIYSHKQLPWIGFDVPGEFSHWYLFRRLEHSHPKRLRSFWSAPGIKMLILEHAEYSDSSANQFWSVLHELATFKIRIRQALDSGAKRTGALGDTNEIHS